MTFKEDSSKQDGDTYITVLDAVGFSNILLGLKKCLLVKYKKQDLIPRVGDFFQVREASIDYERLTGRELTTKITFCESISYSKDSYEFIYSIDILEGKDI